MTHCINQWILGQYGVTFIVKVNGRNMFLRDEFREMPALVAYCKDNLEEMADLSVLNKGNVLSRGQMKGSSSSAFELSVVWDVRGLDGTSLTEEFDSVLKQELKNLMTRIENQWNDDD